MTHVPDTVLLDVDGTLVDSTYLHALAWTRAFRSVSEHPPWAHVHRGIGLGGDKFVTHVLGESAEEEHGDALRTRWKEGYAAVLDEVVVVPGARDLVLELRKRGLRVGLASSGATQFTSAALEMLRLDVEDLDAVTSADDVEESKPAPDLLGTALKQTGGTTGIMVGDTTWDVEAATRSGMRCVAVLTGGFSANELSAAGAIDVVDSVADLIGRDWSGPGVA